MWKFREETLNSWFTPFFIFQVIEALWVYHINPAEIQNNTTKRLEMGDGINENKC